jgi:hypothetical protein
MARTVDSQLNGFLEHCESQSALILTVPTVGTKRWIQEDALIETTIGGNTYLPDLQATDELRQSIENPVDRVSVTIQNVDTDLGIELITNPEKFMFAEATIPRLYRNSRDYSDSQLKTLFRGVVTAVDADEKQVKFEFSPDYVAFGACVAADTFTGDEWKFPELPVSTPPGTGDDIIIIGDPTCPAVSDFIPVDRNGFVVRAGDLKVGDIVWNPVAAKFSTVTKAEIIRNQAIWKTTALNGRFARSSNTHKLIADLADAVGSPLYKLKRRDPVLTFLKYCDQSEIFTIVPDGFEDVIWIELDGERIYASGTDPKLGFLVAHNRKPDPDFIGGVQV